jgi:hypothetical protein
MNFDQKIEMIHHLDLNDREKRKRISHMINESREHIKNKQNQSSRYVLPIDKAIHFNQHRYQIMTSSQPDKKIQLINIANSYNIK